MVGSFWVLFRFKTWSSTQWVATCSSDLRMETQWIFFDFPEMKSHAIIIPILEEKTSVNLIDMVHLGWGNQVNFPLSSWIKSLATIIPIIEGSFRSALQPGSDRIVFICAESGSSKVKVSSFHAIA
ncbi:hypothetical protein L6164_018502 [Bauhinia variegata]|uniref:Uncharacterized protein n=1 Tax=Bauhinia variegata TaxID=167791 RepID=A0ACB9NB60_BAUVA|nr:hypothetical protein L6164_018502 [Bauhinia variegata]